VHDGEGFLVLLGSLGGCGDEEGVVGVMGNMGYSFCIANSLNGRGEFFEEGRARVNTEGNALLVEIKSIKPNTQIELIIWVYAEKTERVLDVDLRKKSRRPFVGDNPKD